MAAALTGFLAERRWDRRFAPAVAAMLTANVVIYLVGLPWLAVVLDTSLEKTLELGLYPFVPGDVFKLYVAASLLPGTWRVVERMGTRPPQSR
jgi:biotin transport system substrate-specific component